MRYFLFLFILFFTLNTGAQQYDFRPFSVKQGLSKTSIYCLFEDSRGYLWIGTQDGGIVSYDGLDFKSYNQSPAVANYSIRTIFEDEDQNLWLGTEGQGLVLYNGESFSNMKDSLHLQGDIIRCIVQDTLGTIWYGTLKEGIVKLEGDTFSVFDKNKGLPSSTVRTALRDRKGTLWFGTDRGLVSYSESKFTKTGFEDLDESRILCLFEDSKGAIWAGTPEGAIRWDAGGLKTWGIQDGLVHPRVRAICEDDQGRIWFGTMEGANCLEGDSIRSFTVKEGLNYNRIRSIYKDSRGNLWFGTFFGGISRLNSESFEWYSEIDGLPNKVINSLYREKDGSILISTWGGVSKLRSGKIIPADLGFEPNSSIINCAIQDKKGRYWIGYERNGMSVYDGNRLKNFTMANGMLDDAVNFLLEDINENIWVLYEDGQLALYDGNSFLDLPGSFGYFDYLVNTVVNGKDGKVWIGTAGDGLLCFTGDSLLSFNLTNSLITSDFINALYCDEEGRIWIGTSEGSVNVYDKGKLYSIGSRKVFRGNDLRSLIFDHHDQLWIAHDLGIDRIFLDKDFNIDSVKNYGTAEGFHGIENSRNASILLDDGSLLLGSINGLIHFDPKKDLPNPFPPQTYLKGIRLTYDTINWKNKGYTIDPLSKLPQNLVLSANDNHLTFDFIGIDLSNPEKVSYSYMLEGADKTWSPASYSHSATFANLRPGRYTFRLKAANSDGIWSPVLNYGFVIQAPFWKTTWFLALCGLAILSGFWLFNSYRDKQHKIREQELTRLVDERTERLSEQKQKAELSRERALRSEKAKELFLANMSHEIRTPMNAITGVTHLLLKQEPLPRQLKYLNTIRKSGENLLVIINDILDISKIEAGKMELEQIDFSIREVIDIVYDTMKFKADEKGLELIKKVGPRVPEFVKGDPTRLNQVLINLVGNALKFTDKGEVKIECRLLELQKDENIIEFRISDTGIGIADDKLQSIFDSFTQATNETARKFGGTGLGLSISKKLIEMQHGKIGVESELNKGTTFFFQITYKEGKAPVEEEELIQEALAEQLKQLRILLVEDNDFNQMVAADTLAHLLSDSTVEVAENGKIAIDMIHKNNYDVVLMDVQMPEMDGHEATIAIRNDPDERINSIPILAMTASVTKSEVDKCFESGMDEFISKPFDTQDLLEKIALVITKAKRANVS